MLEEPLETIEETGFLHEPFLRRGSEASLRGICPEYRENRSIPLRERVFSPELRSLAEDVMLHSGSLAPATVAEASTVPDVEPTPLPDDFIEELRGCFEGSQRIHLDDYHRALLGIYENPEQIESGMDSILKELQHAVFAQAVAVLSLHQKSRTHQVMFHRGLDRITVENLQFRSGDPFLNQEDNYEILRLNHHLQNNINFSKRFGSEALTRFHSIFFVNLNLHDSPSWLLFFYRKEELPDPDELYGKIENKLEHLPSIIESYKSIHWNEGVIEIGNFYLNISKNFIKILNDSGGNQSFIYFHFDPISDRALWDFFLQSIYAFIADLLHRKGEVMLEVGPGRLLVLSQFTDPTHLIESIREFSTKWGNTFEHTILTYPFYAKNILNYIKGKHDPIHRTDQSVSGLRHGSAG